MSQCILERYQRLIKVISVGTRLFFSYGKIQREFDNLTSSNVIPNERSEFWMHLNEEIHSFYINARKSCFYPHFSYKNTQFLHKCAKKLFFVGQKLLFLWSHRAKKLNNVKVKWNKFRQIRWVRLYFDIDTYNPFCIQCSIFKLLPDSHTWFTQSRLRPT